MRASARAYPRWMIALSIGITLAQALAASAAAPPAARELTKTETESLVRHDVTVRLGVPTTDLRVVASDSRTWPDQRLGCVARRGVEEPVPLPGYRIVLEAEGRRFTYHTDLAGRIVRCEARVKRLLPMLR